MQSSGIRNIMGMVLKKQSVSLTLMDLRVLVDVFDLEDWVKTNSGTQQMLPRLAFLNFIIIVLKLKKTKLDSLMGS